jgi:tetratricopeptide (TPR) repeat protein/mono/diheme cytochrome c family protein
MNLRGIATASLLLTIAACGRPGRPSEPAAAEAGAQPDRRGLGAGGPPTFNRDVAPILFEHCAPCHRPSQAAPFPLLRYGDAREQAEKIARATSDRRMPPWLPEPGEPAFAGERRLSAAQIDVIARWVKGGAPEGNAADLPAAPTWTDEWQLGAPDVVVTMPRPYRLMPGSHDVYRNVVIPLALPASRFVRAVEFRTNGAPVHHAVIRVDRTSASRRREGVDGQPGFDGMVAQDVQNPDGHFIGWTPGRGPILAPEGLPWRLERGSDLVVELHLLPGKMPIGVKPTVALFLTDTPPVRSPLVIKMGSKAIDIPAGARDYAVTDTYVLPVEVDLLSIYPHAHYLARDMQVMATLPDGATRRLLHIRQWDFHWQQDYRYVAPMTLPRGTTLAMRYTYDNSAANHDNPHDPPRLVTYGPNATDEMANLGLQVVPRSREDAATLVAAFARREALANVAAAELVSRRDPDSAQNQADLGGSYFEAGRPADAIAPLERAIRIDPRSARAHNYLGGALFALKRTGEAIPAFRQAAALAPREERFHYNLGQALVATGQAEEAARSFQRALAINPDFSEAHANLGVYLFTRGRVADAIVHFRRAAELSPESAVAQGDLGAALAQAGQRADAERYLRRALELDPAYAPARENLERLLRRNVP